MKNECEYIKAQGRLEQSNGHDVRSEDLYKLMCVQGVQRQDVIQCVQPGIIFLWINYTFQTIDQSHGTLHAQFSTFNHVFKSI